MSVLTKAVTEALYGMILAGRELNDRQIGAVADALDGAGLTVDTRDALLDQGVTRLQLLAFLRGEHSDVWNGSNDYPWVRYRAHQIDRNPTPDGNLFRFTHLSIGGLERTAAFTCRVDSDEDALVTTRMIDQIIDAAIAHHGPDGVA